MTKSEAWDTFKRVGSICRTIFNLKSETAYNVLKQIEDLDVVADSLKAMKDYIINEDDTDLAHQVYFLVHDERLDGVCSTLYRLSFDFEDDIPLSQTMAAFSDILQYISYWLLEYVYKVPSKDSYKYNIENGKLVKNQPKKKRRYPSALPHELNTPKACEIMELAKKKGLYEIREVDGQVSYKWMFSKSLLAYFAVRCTGYLGLSKSESMSMTIDGIERRDRMCFAPFEIMFNFKDLRKSVVKYKDSNRTLPKNHEIIDSLFPEN